MSDEDLNGLHIHLTALAFGQSDTGQLDTANSLFNRVATDLGIAMREHWRPDAGFFDRRTKEQLADIVVESGFVSSKGQVSAFKKAELVTGLMRHFDKALAADKPTEAQQKAWDWLPGAMQFPAVDPDVGEDEQV